MDVVKYPDKRLRKRSSEIEVTEISEYRTLIMNMKKTMYESEGVGLAAPQVGVNKRIIVIDPSPVEECSVGFMVMINPVITSFSKDTDVMEEGCLSLPGIIAPVKRSKEIYVEAYDLEGRKIKQDFSGFAARVIQHETDHLNGILFIDRLEYAEKIKIKPLLKELEKEYGTKKK